MPLLEARYDYVGGVQRPSGSDAVDGTYDTDAHLFHLDYRGLSEIKASAYAYFFAIDDNPSLSTRTLGPRILGERRLAPDLAFTYEIEAARQTDWANNPNNFSLGYYLLQPGLVRGRLQTWVGYEVLEGSGVQAVQTPFGNLHRLQGFANVFAVTPAREIIDRQIGFDWKQPRTLSLDSIRLWGGAHSFATVETTTELGRDLDLAVSLGLLRSYTATAKLARFDGDNGRFDTTKFWLMLEANF
ncbi:MAG: hypothetical protein EXQ91_03075 [Alphaproteobacteria bacterium]|nr:hypothetical protein [Alphaproteobacteria bacterium]